MLKMIGYLRVSLREQSADLQEAALAAGVQRGHLYVDHGLPGARASRRTSHGGPQRVTVAAITAIDWVSSIVGGTT
jgi:DNA invertase Pin-like site-specific DNA recombinase